MGMSKRNISEYIMIFLLVLIVVLLGYIIYDKIFVSKDDIETSKLLDNKILDKYKNNDGSVGTMIEYTYRNDNGYYRFGLGLDGRVYVSTLDGKKYFDKVNNIVDMVKFANSASDYSTFYMLSDDGLVYSYNIDDLFTGNYEVTLLEEVKEVSRLIPYQYYDYVSESVVNIWGVLALTKDGEYIELVEDAI